MLGWRRNLRGWVMGWLVAAMIGQATIALPQDAAGTAPPDGIRQLASKHLTLLTDLPSSPEVDALPDLFDQAFGQWCDYFGVDADQHVDWHVRTHLMKSRERFQAAGLLPADLPDFFSGYARADRIWLRDQTSAYYRRHLLLHEATHSFMLSLCGGMGPPWYAEGVAELLSTHRLEDGKLSLNYFPRHRDEVPKLGRIEIVQTGYAAHRALSLARLLASDNRAQQANQWYGWCWAAAAFLDGHPRYQARFRQLHKQVGDIDDRFNQHVMETFADDWARLNDDWQLFVANLDYGYDFRKMDVEFTVGEPLGDAGQTISIAADRSWQSSGVRLEAGHSYRLRAAGRYQVAAEPRAWLCEPGGVTIRYYRAQPLGILLSAVRADEASAQSPSGLLKPIVVGLGTTLDIQQAGTLYLRINDSAGSLGDNAGSLSVEITRDE